MYFLRGICGRASIFFGCTQRKFVSTVLPSVVLFGFTINCYAEYSNDLDGRKCASTSKSKNERVFQLRCDRLPYYSVAIQTEIRQSEILTKHSKDLRLDKCRDNCGDFSDVERNSKPSSSYRFGGLAYSYEISIYANRYRIDPDLLHAIAYVESRYNANAVSPKGAVGLMQLMPATARSMGHAGPRSALFNAETNLKYACIYLRYLYKQFGNDLPLVLAAYNAGENSVIKYGRQVPPYRETQKYVDWVLIQYEKMRTT
jgi:hypothetical protein